MKPTQALAFLAIAAGRMLLSGSNKLSWDTVNSWVVANSNSDDLGRGFVGGTLGRRSGNAYADIHRGRSSRGKIQVTASIIFDARQGAAMTKTWEADKMDSKLEKKFGDNRSFRITL